MCWNISFSLHSVRFGFRAEGRHIGFVLQNKVELYCLIFVNRHKGSKTRILPKLTFLYLVIGFFDLLSSPDLIPVRHFVLTDLSGMFFDGLIYLIPPPRFDDTLFNCHIHYTSRKRLPKGNSGKISNTHHCLMVCIAYCVMRSALKYDLDSIVACSPWGFSRTAHPTRPKSRNGDFSSSFSI